ncbi:LamG domain-containing protein [Flavobacteriaceae bacterium SZ-1-7]|uniref:LamG domain-containing protein n=1 Tax=Tamlana sedimenti TaxID=3134126 RepID=UPI00312844B9
MKSKLPLLLTIIPFLLWGIILRAQTCGSYTFSPPSLPTTCSYTYTSSGWVDSSGNPTMAPTIVNSGTSVCIMADNSDLIASTGFKGTLYVAPGVTYSGIIASVNGAVLHVEGTIDFPTNPSFQNATVYVYQTGAVSVPGTFNPAGSSIVYNNGLFNIGGELQMGGSATFVSFNESRTTVQLDAGIASDYSNCGILEVFGSLSSGGSSALVNDCSIFIHTDMNLNADYTNNGLFVLSGNLSFGTAKFFNNGTMLLDNINLSNDELIGNDVDSILIVRNNASLTSGASITGHMYYDMDDGGGFDTVCGSCTEDIDVLLDVTIPPTEELLLEDCGLNIEINPVIFQSKLDFDGVDDYVSTPKFIEGVSEVTIMAWVKSDLGNTDNMTIAGEDSGCRLWLKKGSKPVLTLNGTGFSEKSLESPNDVNLNEWHHVAGTYTSTTGAMELYIDGLLVNTGSVSVTGSVIENTSNSNGNFEIGRKSSNISNQEYFKGDIDEVRVFDIVLTQEQIQQMVYQEIEENLGKVQGKIIPKDIEDLSTNTTINWSTLLAYYPMADIISYDRTTDYSNNDRITKLHNITSFQQQTAPMPFETGANGCWCTEGTWLHGDVWDIENVANVKDWSIVRVSHNLSTSNSHTNLGLIIDSGKTFTIQSDNLIQNTWYLELNGTLDLADDSQLVQTVKSDLVTSASGKVMRRQEGTNSPYRYNYWSSPVGTTGVTSLTDNNSASHNTNNSNFQLQMLKDASGLGMGFTSSYTASGNISTYWLYTYINGLNYWDWASIGTSTALSPGVGYTQKGTGNPGTEQQYIFEGKPNNGTILLNVTDKGGPGSVPNASKTEYLLGNPYASALDVHQFIDDNVGVIDGTLQLWQQWSGSSHNLSEYNGGYAQVNKLGSTRAYQFVGFYGAHNGSQDGTIVPTRYLPVGQGFIAEIVADGQVEFNNGQRVFIKESDADGTYNNGSVFSKGSSGKSSKAASTSNVMKKIRLEFSSTAGPETRRELLLGFSDYTTDAFDYGYDAKCTESNNNDLNLSLEGQNMTMQAYSAITADKAVPLNFKSSGDNAFEIRATELENMEEGQEIYLRDNLTGSYFDLTQDVAYAFSSGAGVFNSRFEIVFQSQSQLLGVEESMETKNSIYYLNNNKTLYVKKLHNKEGHLALLNMHGQTILEMENLLSGQLAKGVELKNVASGSYMVCLRTEANEVLTKKIIVN